MGFDNRGLGNMWSGSDEIWGDKSGQEAPTAEQLRTYIETEMAQADEVVNRQKTADDFVGQHPEYIDGGPTGLANGKLMNFELQQRGYWPNPSLEQFEDVYSELSQAGMLKLNQSVITAERAKALDERAAQIKANRFNEDAAYSMTADQLRAKARGQEYVNDPLCPADSRV